MYGRGEVYRGSTGDESSRLMVGQSMGYLEHRLEETKHYFVRSGR